MMIDFAIPGKPVPKMRARVLRNGYSYTPKKTADFENLVKLIAIARRNALKLSISGGDFSVKVIFYGANPLADLDNLIKSILDGCNGAIWEDDRQVVHLEARRAACLRGQEQTVVNIQNLGVPV